MSGTHEKASASEDELASRFEREALPHLPKLYPAALRMTNDPDDAGELVEETFAHAYREYPHQRPGTNLRAWLYRILVNLHRATHRGRRTTDRPDAAGGEPTRISVEREDLESLPSSVVIQALRELPVNERIAVYLSDVEGFGYDDIADITQTPVDTVVSRLHDGRRILRRHLERSAGRD